MCVDAAKKADNTVLVCLPSAYTAMVLYVIDSPLLLDGDIFGARSFTGMGRGATTKHESDVSRTEVEENSHDTTTVINSQIRI